MITWTITTEKKKKKNNQQQSIEIKAMPNLLNVLKVSIGLIFFKFFFSVFFSYCIHIMISIKFLEWEQMQYWF